MLEYFSSAPMVMTELSHDIPTGSIEQVVGTELRTPLLQEMEHIFDGNIREGTASLYGKETPYAFITPSPQEYGGYQWWWDTAVHALAISHVDPERAQREILNHLKAQQDDGFVPHIVFWDQRKQRPFWAETESKIDKPEVSALTQPPIMAIAAERVAARSPEASRAEFLDKTLDPLFSYHKWLHDERDLQDTGLVSIISANESGMDELPVFQLAFQDPYTGSDPDELNRRYREVDERNTELDFDLRNIAKVGNFDVKCVSFNVTYCEANRALARMFEDRGQPEDMVKAQTLREWADRTEEALLTTCYDEEDHFFYSQSVNAQGEMTPLKVKTVDGLIPLMLENIGEERATKLVEEHLMNPDEFWTQYPIPTVAASEGEYYVPNPGPEIDMPGMGLLWRGPTWSITNWLVTEGLIKHGFLKPATEITVKTAQMVRRESREFYSPDTGQGYRVRDFGMNFVVVESIEQLAAKFRQSPRVYSSQS
jgi:glycogen debranching enzyme